MLFRSPRDDSVGSSLHHNTRAAQTRELVEMGMNEPSAAAKRQGAGSENSFGSRVRRYAQVGGTVGVQAARMAGARLMGRPLDLSHATDLKEALGGLKGPLMKVAQLLATIPDALPAEFAAELAQLQSNAPPMGKPFVRRRMTSELGADWQRHFRAFPLEAAAAASLGQVHKAVLQDGRSVACKLQYPNIEAAVEADLAQLRVIFALYRRYDSTIDTSRIFEEIAARLDVSPNTVKTHVANLFEKLGAKGRMDAINRARELGIVP